MHYNTRVRFQSRKTRFSCFLHDASSSLLHILSFVMVQKDVYKRQVTLNKLRPLILEEMCAELRKRKNRRGEPVCEATVHKYLETVSAVLEDAKRNDILLYNPAHRVRGDVYKRQTRTPARVLGSLTRMGCRLSLTTFL